MIKIEIVDIDEYPSGEPLERPLHKKRRRLWSPASKQTITTPTPVGGSSESGLDQMSPALTPTTITSVAGSSRLEQNLMSPALVPSPAMFVQSSPRTPVHSIYAQAHNGECLENYGSEGESDDGNEEAVISIPPSRVIEGSLDTPNDEQMEIVLPIADADAQSEPGMLHMPNDFFDFRWTQYPDPPLPPETRREPFSHADVGPTSPCKDAYTIFVAIWNREIMEHIALETNRYAQQVATQKINNNSLGPKSRINLWKDTSADELYIYFAMILAMGVIVKSKIEEYWATDESVFATPYFSAYMTLQRFQLLSSCLHFANNENMCAEELTPSKAKLFKIAPIIDHLNSKFQESYIMGQNVALDESLLKWKGWLNINQFIRTKAATVGIKTYELCESQTGYLWLFEVHIHKKTSLVPQELETPLDASTPAIVLRLLNGLKHKGHTVWMDNFYNSPALARKLKTLGFDVVGTLRTNRQFVPHELANLTKSNMKPGQITGFTSGDVDILVWRDQNRVATVSTYHGNATATGPDGNTKPILILDYNIMMGSVDKKDQMLAMYPIERKRTSVWYKKLFRRLLNVSVLNSFIIAKKSGSSVSHRNFRYNLVCSLLSRHSTPKSIQIHKPTNTFEAKTHYLVEHPIGQNKSRLRRRCCVCKVLTHFYCAGCEKSVCISQCFVSLHS